MAVVRVIGHDEGHASRQGVRAIISASTALSGRDTTPRSRISFSH